MRIVEDAKLHNQIGDNVKSSQGKTATLSECRGKFIDIFLRKLFLITAVKG